MLHISERFRKLEDLRNWKQKKNVFYIVVFDPIRNYTS